jgi:hypothetical protein
MSTLKYFSCIVLLVISSRIYSQDQTILIFDPNGVSTSFQYALSQLTEDSVFLVDTLDDEIFNYDGLFLFVNYPYILSEVEENILIQYTAEGKPAYIFSNLLFQPPIDSASLWHHIGFDEIQGLLIAVQVDSVTGIDTTFTDRVFIDTSFISWSVPVVTGNVDPILTAWWSGSHFNSTFISSYDSLNVILDLYNLIDDEGFLRRVLEYFELIPQQQYVQINFFPQVDTALVNGGCTTPEIICKNLSSTNERDSISIEPGFNTYFYYYDSTGTQITLDNYYFIVIDSLDEYNYELWFHPKSYPPFEPVLIEFDSIFYSDQNKYDIQLIVKKNGMRIDSLSQPFHADFGLSVDDSGIFPNEFILSQNYPNPFNPSTKIEFRIADFGFVTLKVYDILGNEIATLVNEEKLPGSYKVEFNVAQVSRPEISSGIYFYQLKSGSYIETKKMVLMK